MTSRDISALIITYNEEANIERTLSSLNWLDDILIIDSGSTDSTCTLALKFPGVRIVKRKFDSFAGQCNYGLSLITTNWVLSLDADYVVPVQLRDEICSVLNNTEINQLSAYSIRFLYCISGKPLRGTLLPPRTSLYRPLKAMYNDDGHGHRIQINGSIGYLQNYLLHDDRKPISRWLASQEKYMRLEAFKLTHTSSARLTLVDKIRKHTHLMPLLAVIYCLGYKGCIFDGWQGWFYSLQRSYAELLLCLFLLNQRNESKNVSAS